MQKLIKKLELYEENAKKGFELANNSGDIRRITTATEILQSSRKKLEYAKKFELSFEETQILDDALFHYIFTANETDEKKAEKIVKLRSKLNKLRECL